MGCIKMTSTDLTKQLKPFGLCCICGDNKVTIYDYCGQVVDSYPHNVCRVTKTDIMLLTQQYKQESKVRAKDKTHKCDKQIKLF
jgi:hypothetical protein